MQIKWKQDIYKVMAMFYTKKHLIQLWDNHYGNCIIECLDTDTEIGFIKVSFMDTVNGTRYEKWVSETELLDLIWDNRGFVNNSGMLDGL